MMMIFSERIISMIKTKYFIDGQIFNTDKDKWDLKRLDEQINQFIKDNDIQKVIDIKYSPLVTGSLNNLICSMTTLLIYEDIFS